MPWLAKLFQDVGDLFYWLYYQFGSVYEWIEDNVGWSGLANIFLDIAYFFQDLWLTCYDIAEAFDDLWEWLGYKFAALETLWVYVYGWITDTANEAINAASMALSMANQAINAAAAAFQKAISEAAAALTAAKEYAETLIPDIAAWVTGHALDLYNAIKGYITEFVFVVGNYIAEIWAALEGFVADAIAAQLALIAAPINLVNQWFDSIQGFFNDPWGWLEAQFESWFEEHW